MIRTGTLTDEDLYLLQFANIVVDCDYHTIYHEKTPEGDLVPTKGLAAIDVDIDEGENKYEVQLEVTLFTKALESNTDRDETLIHELIHVRDYLKGHIPEGFYSRTDKERYQQENNYEAKVQHFAEITIKNNPSIVSRLIEILEIDNYPNLESKLSI